jgi:hypothetical protein
VRYCLLRRYILISVYIVLNLFVGSIVNGSMEAAEEERIKKTEVQEWQGLQVSVMHIVAIPAVPTKYRLGQRGTSMNEVVQLNRANECAGTIAAGVAERGRGHGRGNFESDT